MATSVGGDPGEGGGGAGPGVGSGMATTAGQAKWGLIISIVIAVLVVAGGVVGYFSGWWK